MNKSAENYFIEGCGRCMLGGTPECKVHTWANELSTLRKIILSVGLIEECKWGVPCYTYGKKNVVLLHAFKDYCAVSVIKGALLKDEAGVLTTPTENSQSGRQIRCTDVKWLEQHEDAIRACLLEAIDVEKAGLKVAYKETKDFDFPAELTEKLESMPEFRLAFEALTPGRQRGYILYFSGAKQSATRTSRIDNYIPRIMAGKGIHDR
jgi:uncharacterized protein YdeI (YjbR/CyaY-like superfamily)